MNNQKGAHLSFQCVAIQVTVCIVNWGIYLEYFYSWNFFHLRSKTLTILTAAYISESRLQSVPSSNMEMKQKEGPWQQKVWRARLPCLDKITSLNKNSKGDLQSKGFVWDSVAQAWSPLLGEATLPPLPHEEPGSQDWLPHLIWKLRKHTSSYLFYELILASFFFFLTTKHKEELETSRKENGEER